MSLYLGKIGRRILNYTVTHPRLNRAVDVFGNAAHKVTFGRYTPGLSRESFLLYQRTSSGDKIKVKEDGFYRDEEKIAGNKYVSLAFLNAGIKQVDLNDNDSPEAVANLPRYRIFSAMHDLASLSFPGIFLYSSVDALDTFINFGFDSTLSNLSGMISLTFLFLSSPTYKLAEWIVNRNKRHWPRPLFYEIERHDIATFETMAFKRAVAFKIRGIDVVFLTTNIIGRCFPHKINIFHEKAHALGASEPETYRSEKIFLFKYAASASRYSTALFLLALLWSSIHHIHMWWNIILSKIVLGSSGLAYVWPGELAGKRGDQDLLLKESESVKIMIDQKLEKISRLKETRNTMPILRLLMEELMRDSVYLSTLYKAMKQNNEAVEVMNRAYATINMIRGKMSKQQSGYFSMLILEFRLLVHLAFYFYGLNEPDKALALLNQFEELQIEHQGITNDDNNFKDVFTIANELRAKCQSQ